MKRLISFFLCFCLIISLFTFGASAEQGVFSREPFVSTYDYTPAKGNCFYIYAPLSGENITCEVSIYDELGVLVYYDVREKLSTNVQTFLWDACPAPGNAAAYDSGSYVQPGVYTVTVTANSADIFDQRTMDVYIGCPGYWVDDEEGIPNYTGNAQCDYLAQLILDEIGVYGLSNSEKYEAIYTWVQENCYRENSTYKLDKDAVYYDLSMMEDPINEYKIVSDLQHEEGLINYDVGGYLETKLALKMMLYRIGTCYEFSSLLEILLEHEGIEAYVYGGYFHNSDGSVVVHKWNYFRLNGTYYWSDVRIDNASYERSGRIKLYFDYMLEENTATWKKRHSWDENEFPILSTATPEIIFVPVTVSVPSVTSYVPQDQPTGVRRYSVSTFADMSPRKTITTSSELGVYGGGIYKLEAYNIDGYNYFKLRDIACILSGTNAQFAVGWNEEYSRVTLTSGALYTMAGGELTSHSVKNPRAVPSSNEMVLDGENISLAAYFINESNYFRLRDLAILFDFAVGWDEAANLVTIDPTNSYSE